VLWAVRAFGAYSSTNWACLWNRVTLLIIHSRITGIPLVQLQQGAQLSRINRGMPADALSRIESHPFQKGTQDWIYLMLIYDL
jgi:hypothetical protein